jgi:hypothetical protein
MLVLALSVCLCRSPSFRGFTPHTKAEYATFREQGRLEDRGAHVGFRNARGKLPAADAKHTALLTY